MSLDSNLGSAPVGDSYKNQWKALSAWFLGPRAENWDVFMDTFKEIFQEHVRLRNNYFPSDPAYITDEMKSSPAYHSEVENMKEELMIMQEQMGGNVPFFSPRYQGHMVRDTTMPALLGYMGAMLFNQNNVDSAASPVTTLYEQQVGQQLCDMLGYNITPGKKLLAWGHVTCGGTIANMEAVWASRNIKFVPLAVRAALLSKDAEVGPLTFLSEDQVRLGLQFTLVVYNNQSKRMEPTALKECTNWQLLNVDIDDICDLVENIIRFIIPVEDASQYDEYESKLKVVVEQEGIMSLGLFNFLEKHGLEHSPVYTSPASNHYSWPKAGTLLGLGSDALIPIELDVNFRQNVDHLRQKLEEFLEKEIPVISVTAVLGSTNESAVDPIKEMYDLRKEFKAKGLNFALLVDGQWGAYFKTMLKESPGKDKDLVKESSKRKFDGFVPYCELSPYVQKQYEHIQFADTITVDPHKSGFCPYPSGALCYRNGKMRYPIALFHPEVFHGEDDPTMGVYGIEGSKPGAAPAGILMSHNVIGLSNRGYGRILGQCTATAKLFYAMWLAVARDDDPFVCVPLQRVSSNYDMESAKKLIENGIAFKPMADIYRDKKAKEFLRDCGPDTAINTFVVNLRDNKDVKKANKLQVALSDAMSIFVGTDARRVPLMIAQSVLDAKTGGMGLKDFKERAGLLDDGDLQNMNVMINTCMNPWQWNESIFAIGELFRRIVLNCIGRLKDAVVTHKFILSGSFVDEAKDESIFMEYLTCTDVLEHQYQVSVKVEAESAEGKQTLSNYIGACSEKNLPVIFETVTPSYDDKDDNVPNLYNILHLQDWKQKICVKLVNDPDGNIIPLKVLDIPRYQRLDMSSTVTYPEKQKYFIYGDSTRTIMSHVMSKLPDFQHTVTLSGRPHSLTETMLELGVMAEVEGVESPLKGEMVDGEIIQPLQRSCYEISFTGELHATIHTSINFKETLFFKNISSPSA